LSNLSRIGLLFLLRSKYFKVVQGQWASSAPANAWYVSDSWLSCWKLYVRVDRCNYHFILLEG